MNLLLFLLLLSVQSKRTVISSFEPGFYHTLNGDVESDTFSSTSAIGSNTFYKWGPVTRWLFLSGENHYYEKAQGNVIIQQYIVQKIQAKISQGKIEYLVLWDGYSKEASSWVTEENVTLYSKS